MPLPGLLTIPVNRTGPVAALLLLAGSGPEDRDESIGPNKVLRDVAQGLASRGIATLRYDKRTLVAGRTMKASTITVEEEVLADADSALALLRRTPDVDPKRIFVLGHSLTASLAPVIAARNPSLRGAVMLAASARPILQLVSDQFRYLSTIETDSTRATALDSLSRAALTFEDSSLPDSTTFMGITLHYQRDLDARQPLQVAQTLDLPMLIVQGGRDYQVTMADFDRWQAALGQKEHVTFRLFNELNHLMISGEGPPSPKEYEVPSHVDSRVIDEVVTFVQGQ
ncbi:MAG: alpha/beta hydrolase [Candidatus Eisenbacteria bacterium]